MRKWAPIVFAAWILLPSCSKSGSITGTVVDSAGFPVAGATVYIAFNELEDPRRVTPAQPFGTADSHGRFTIAKVSPMKGFLVATYGGMPDSPAVPVTVTSAGAHGVRIILTDGAVIEGVVRSPQGPVAHREVILWGHQQERTTTDEHGRFAFRGVRASQYYGLRAATIPGDKLDYRKRVSVRDGETVHVELQGE